MVPDQAPSIQAAIDARADTVLVRPGVYPESVTVRSTVFIAGQVDAGQDRPIVNGLAIIPLSGARSFRFERLEFSGRVHIHNDDGRIDLAFTGCLLGAGIIDDTHFWSTRSISLETSVLRGSVQLFVDGGLVVVDSCMVAGTVIISGNSATVEVRRCTFDGQGVGGALSVDGAVTCSVQDNVVRGYQGGIGISSDYSYCWDNTVEDCLGDGLSVWGSHVAMVANNTVRRCAMVRVVATADLAHVSQNRVEDCVEMGMWIGGVTIELIENVVRGSGGDGFTILAGNYLELRVVRNTSCSNGWSGFAVVGQNQRSGTARIEGNIGFGNGHYGLTWPPADPVTFGCNDWFGNASGEVEGVQPGQSDFSEDPKFCDVEMADYHLQADSPLVDRPGCGRIGALGVGCATTTTVVRMFMAERMADGVRVRWEVAERARTTEIWLERSDAGTPTNWVRPVTERTEDGRFVEELDRSAALDGDYWYRLAAQDGNGVAPLVEPVRVVPVAGQRFALEQVVASDGGGVVRIRFSLAHAAAIGIEVFDVQGRAVASVARGAWPAGRHEVEWDGFGRGGEPTPAGWYAVRYRYPGGHESRRVVRTF